MCLKVSTFLIYKIPHFAKNLIFAMFFGQSNSWVLSEFLVVVSCNDSGEGTEKVELH